MATVDTYKLKTYRKLKSVNQADIAEALGMPSSTFATKERKGDFNQEEIVIIAKALHVRPEELMKNAIIEATITEGPLQGIEQHLEQIEENMLALATKLLKGQEQILNFLTQRNGHSIQVLPGEKPLRKGSQK